MFRRRLSEHGHVAILIAGWLVFCLYCYPGLMTKDSFDQLAEARSGFFLDDHPPVMAALWSITDHIVSGPFGMLVVRASRFSSVATSYSCACCAPGSLRSPHPGCCYFRPCSR